MYIYIYTSINTCVYTYAEVSVEDVLMKAPSALFVVVVVVVVVFLVMISRVIS